MTADAPRGAADTDADFGSVELILSLLLDGWGIMCKLDRRPPGCPECLAWLPVSMTCTNRERGKKKNQVPRAGYSLRY